MDERTYLRRVVRFMRKQGGPARQPIDGSETAGECVNFTRDGKKCAIACVFTDASARKFTNARLGHQLAYDGVRKDVTLSALRAHDGCLVIDGVDWPSDFQSDLSAHLRRLELEDLANYVDTL